MGVRAWGATTEEVFEQATRGLLDITGASEGGTGERVAISVGANDLGGVLVDWLEEVLYVQDARDAVITGLKVSSATHSEASGWIEITQRSRDIEGTAVKAITYHQLVVSQRDDETWFATVYFDI